VGDPVLSGAPAGFPSVGRMRILVNTGPSFGLYFPVVPLIWSLRLAGHQVLVAGPENMAAAVTGSGLPFTPVHRPLEIKEVIQRDREGRVVRFQPTEVGQLEDTGRGFGRLAARIVDGLLEAADRWRPDVVVGEPHAYSAAMVAALRGLPYVVNGLGLGFLGQIDEWGEAELAPELRRLGLDRLPGPDLAFDFCPPAVRAPDAPPGQPLRYVPYDRPNTVPVWVFEKPKRPRVLLTLGTVPAPGRKEIYGRLLSRLPSLGVEIVLAVSDDALAELPDLPDAVIAAGWVPHASVLPTCDLAVHHCGAGTTMMALTAGVPQVLVPFITENEDAARRLDAFGAARHFPSRDWDPTEAVNACEELLEDPGYRQQAVRLRDEIAAMPAPGTAVTAIEDLVGASRR
jgi:UDP:flavonoid glycosyltransferase YjiC (YdhE family)